jgi:hypothetical protein
LYEWRHCEALPWKWQIILWLVNGCKTSSFTIGTQKWNTKPVLKNHQKWNKWIINFLQWDSHLSSFSYALARLHSRSNKSVLLLLWTSTGKLLPVSCNLVF